MFKFNFSFDDVDVDTKLTQEFADAVIFNGEEPELAKDCTQEYLAPFEEFRVEDLLEKLPDVISYSSLFVPVLSPNPLKIPGSGSENNQTSDYTQKDSAGPPSLKLLRRDLFDVRFQLAVQSNLNLSNDDEGGGSKIERNNDAGLDSAVFIENPSDLITGVYEGGFKTWECSLDLVGCLEGQSCLRDQEDELINWSDVSQKRTLELGCGTAIPSTYLLYQLFNSSNHLHNATTELHLQDYNASVLELVSLPNLLLAWYLSEASVSYRSSTATQIDMEDDDADNGNDHHLSLTPALRSAFLQSLEEYKIKIRFFAGSWLGFLKNVLSEAGETGSKPYDLVLTSETIYSKKSLGELVDVLKFASSSGAPGHHPCLCLVAAKQVYFGVGGGMEEFIREVEKKGGVMCGVVWEGPGERHGGVKRKVIQLAW